MERMCAFMARNHPDEDWMNKMMAAQREVNISDRVGDGCIDLFKKTGLRVSRHGLCHDKYRCSWISRVDDVEESMDNVQTTESDPKEAQFANGPTTSQDLGNRTGKASTRKESPEQQTSQQVNISKRVNTAVIQHKVDETAESNENVRTSKKSTKRARAAKAKEHCQNSSSAHETKI